MKTPGLASVVLLCVFISLVVVPQAAGQEGGGELFGSPWWKNGLSLTFSMIAVVCISHAVIDLGIKHRGFWGWNFLAAILIIGGLILVKFGSPLFWLAMAVGIGFILILVTLAVTRAIVKKLVR